MLIPAFTVEAAGSAYTCPAIELPASAEMLALLRAAREPLEKAICHELEGFLCAAVMAVADEDKQVLQRVFYGAMSRALFPWRCLDTYLGAKREDLWQIRTAWLEWMIAHLGNQEEEEA